MITPNGIVKLLNVPLDKSQQNQIRFATRTAQTSYFAALAVHSYSDVTFTRKDLMIKVPAHIDTLWNCNYVMYNNIDQGSRYFYAFIGRMEWLSENSTAIFIKTDVYQTWMLDCEFRRSFVIREHVSSDVFGLHTIEEGLETGEYVCNTAQSQALLGPMDIIIATTVRREDITSLANIVTGSIAYEAVGAKYYGVYSGCNFYGCTDPEQVSAFIKLYNAMGKLDAIVAVFMAPNIYTGATAYVELLDIPENGSIKDVSAPAMPTTIDGYTPKNSKLFCYPYNFINVSNNNGSQGIFRWERFLDKTADHFSLIGGVSPGAIYKLIPNYRSNGRNYNDFDEAMTLGGFPTCCFTGSAFQTYLAQSVPGAALAAAGAVAGILTGNAPITLGGIAAVGSQLAGLAGKAIQPPQLSGNMGSGNANASLNLNDFIINGKSIKYEYAQIIDDFFTMYGYKVNRIKVPELASRPVWNYVQTAGANITGDIPQDDLVELKQMFDKGLTLWHSGANLANYSLDNTL